ncbi:MAG: asparaginase [Phycisphaera sp.]|nr:MAG: asparaginase [Phycisphaera sp.]
MHNARGYIQLIATGGTISAGPEGPLRASSIIKMARRLPADVPIRGEDLLTVPSSRFSVDDLHRLAERVNEAVSDEACLGVVVTHGTDSMEESALAVELLGAPSKPVVFTGAMVPTRDAGADGPTNVADAFDCVLSDSAQRLGTVVVMNQRIHAALDVRKLHTENKDAFASGDSGPIGLISPETVEIVRSPARLGFRSSKLEERVELVTLTTGLGGARMIKLAARDGARGIVVEAFGAGNLPERATEAAARAMEEGVVVLVTSRVPTGDMELDSPAAKAGLIPAITAGRRLPGPSARILLMAQLGEGLGENQIRTLLLSGSLEELLEDPMPDSG